MTTTILTIIVAISRISNILPPLVSVSKIIELSLFLMLVFIVSEIDSDVKIRRSA